MDKITDVQATAKSGADSVFNYIQRTAEVVEDGIRWQTLGSKNKRHYHIGVVFGVAGISFFLSDYYRLTGITKARELASGALEWSSSPNRTDIMRGVGNGLAGIGRGWLLLSQVIDDSDVLTGALALGDRLLYPTSLTDFLGGTAGVGIFHIRLWEASGDEQYFAAAVRFGESLNDTVIRDERGCYWKVRTDEEPPRISLGFAHGVSGIGYFLLALYEATGDSRWAELAQGLGDTLSNQAKPDRGGLNWPMMIDTDEIDRCQWCHGAPGVGLFYAKAYEVLGELSYLETAKASGETTFAYGDVRNNPSQCHGLAGNAELFIELYRLTQERLWLERAHDFARLALSYRKTTPEGDVWQGDVPGYDSPAFLDGASGVGHFFLRLLAPDRLRMPLL